MAIGDIVVCLDVGASKVSCIVGQVNKFSKIEVIGHGMSNNGGLKKGIIYDPKITAESIKNAINAAEEIAGLNIKSAYVNIKGMNVRIERLSVIGDVEKPDEGLSYNDIYNLYKKMQTSIQIDEKKEQIIDIIPYCYYLNDRQYKEEPIGAFCKQFTIDGDIVLGKNEYIESILASMQLADLKIDGLVLESLATSSITLMPEEKKLGVLMIDVGASHTEVSVYHENRLEFYTALPVGSDYITNDISIAFDISPEEAEKLKRQYNLAMEIMINNNHEIKLNTVKDKDKPNMIRCSDVVGVIEARISQINSVIRSLIVENMLLDKVECAVITGQGISNIAGVEELVSLNLKLSQVRICSPKIINIVKPQYITAYGIAKQISVLGMSKHINSDVEILIEPTIKDKIFNIFFKSKLKKKKNKKEVKDIEEIDSNEVKED
ncbi:MAG: cell division protein FtsA [Clostridia bacterium]